MRQTGICLVVFLLTASFAESTLWGFNPFRRVEADPNNAYELHRDHGPWMILATSFKGQQARQQAHQLVLELRRDYRLPAFVHQRNFDFTKPVVGLGVTRYHTPKMMRHARPVQFQEVAVLVGQFESVDHPAVKDVLQKLKYAQFKSIKPIYNEQTGKWTSNQSFGALRALQRKLSRDESKRRKGPLGNAFVTRNPLLPAEYFAAKGMDPLVEKMNRNVQYSLLKNPRAYSVRVARFRGLTTVDQGEVARLKGNNQQFTGGLADAFDKAHRLAEALRRRNIEAYEFHDLHESIVTVGSFDSIGQPADGKLNLHPQVHQIMQAFSAERKLLPNGTHGLVPRVFDGIHCDVQAMPVKTPRVSVAAMYNRNR